MLSFYTIAIFTFLTLFPLLSGGYLFATSDEVDIELLKNAWRIPTGGANNKPYYSITVDGYKFYGERNWDLRWELIKDVIDYENKNILELGSNVALAATYLKKYRNAGFCLAVDRPDELLKLHDAPNLITAAKMIHQAFGVDIAMGQLDLNHSDYEAIIGENFDVVISMSILKWVDDKERFLDYLGRFKNVIYEGHDDDEIEIARFKQRGFDAVVLGKTQVGVSYPDDAERTVIYFFKS